MIRVNTLLTQYFLTSIPLFILFRLSITQCWPKCAGSFLFQMNLHSSSLTVLYLASDLLHAITPAALLFRFPFSSWHTTDIHPFLGYDTVLVHSIGDPDWNFYKDSIISSDHTQNVWFFVFCCLSPIYTLWYSVDQYYYWS